MAVRDLPIVGDSFNVGFRFQRYWDTPMANAFFSCEAGAGLFFVSLLLGNVNGMILGLAVGITLKSFFHITHMGVPLKSWRAILRPDRSWISRGLMGIGALVVFGAAHILIVGYGWGDKLGLPGAITDLVKFGAAISAAVCMTYQGFAMSHSSAISLWNTGMMPVSSFAYSINSGLLLYVALNAGSASGMLRTATIISCVALAAVVISVMHASRHGSPGAQKSFDLLTKSIYAKWFFGCVWLLGIIGPMLVMWLVPGQQNLVIAAAISALIGHYAYRVLIFKAGVFEPIMSFRP